MSKVCACVLDWFKGWFKVKSGLCCLLKPWTHKMMWHLKNPPFQETEQLEMFFFSLVITPCLHYCLWYTVNDTTPCALKRVWEVFSNMLWHIIKSFYCPAVGLYKKKKKWLSALKLHPRLHTPGHKVHWGSSLFDISYRHNAINTWLYSD